MNDAIYYKGSCSLLYRADCSLPLPIKPQSVDALVTDPPAGIKFMGKLWDADRGGRDGWVKHITRCFEHAFVALKPGAYGLVWALPRRSHWTAWALELAGFSVLDIVHHIYAEGWPKNHDISVAIDKTLGATRPVVGVKNNTYDGATRDPSKHSNPAADSSFGEWGLHKTPHGLPLTAPATDEAKKWAGWGTALKPAAEHWILVRRPPSEKTLAKNVMKHGVGGINIEAGKLDSGRWPTNLVHDGNVLADKSHFFYAAKPGKKERNLGCTLPNTHASVKSCALMDYLVTLITPPGGIVLDIFAGSGTTGVAAARKKFQFIGIENDEVSLRTARERLAHEQT